MRVYFDVLVKPPGPKKKKRAQCMRTACLLPTVGSVSSVTVISDGKPARE